MEDAVIVATARSPIGRARKGSLTAMRADQMSLQMVQAALAKVPELDPRTIDDLVLGCSQPAGEAGYNLGRVVTVLAGLDDVPGTTVHRYCASSLQAARIAFHAIRAGEGDTFLAVGTEAVSRFDHGRSDGMPDTQNSAFDDAKRRSAQQAETGDRWSDPRDDDLIPDVHLAMGQTAENVASLCGITRRDQDEFALSSQNRAEAAINDGFWKHDITPLTLPNGEVVSTDDGPRAGVTLDALMSLEPVFRPNGTVTAGNCCPLNDGAAALVIMSATKAQELGLEPLARIVSTGVSGLSPEIMGLGPVKAVRQALRRARMSINDVDLVEMNEAFAAQVIPCARQLDIPFDKLNVNGGAIAVGHPFGMTGARLVTTQINSLNWHDKQIGIVTMCAAGGQGMAMVLERLHS